MTAAPAPLPRPAHPDQRAGSGAPRFAPTFARAAPTPGPPTSSRPSSSSASRRRSDATARLVALPARPTTATGPGARARGASSRPSPSTRRRAWLGGVEAGEFLCPGWTPGPEVLCVPETEADTMTAGPPATRPPVRQRRPHRAGAALRRRPGFASTPTPTAPPPPELDEADRGPQAEAAEHGDEEQVALCADALNGDTDAQCVPSRLADAAAMDDGE